MNICNLCQLSSPSGCTKLNNEACLKDAPKLIRATATNGDVIRALFPDCTFSHGNSCSYLKFKGNLFTMAVEDAWWNAPYKAGDTDGNS